MAASGFKKLRVALLCVGFVVIAFIAFSSKNKSLGNSVSPTPEHDGKTQQTDVEAPVNFVLPLYTKRAALVCPLTVAFDRREGYGLKGAVDAHLSIFGHEEAVEKSGCEEWREGLPVSLTDEGQKQATEWETEKNCGMVSFADGYIFSCDLQNSSDEEALEHAEQQITNASHDPSKLRLMECMGVNPWKEKPAGWTPPTEEECKLLKQKLGTAAAKEETSLSGASNAQPKDVALLIAQEEKLNDTCRGGSGDDTGTQKACDQRDALFKEIKARNWCWGHDGQIETDRDWEPCPSQ